MKKISSLIIMMFLICVLSVRGIAISIDAGGDFSTAKTINMNTLYTDNIASSGDIDFFRFDMKEPGLVSVEVYHDIIFDSGEVWKGILYNQYGEEIYDYSFVGNKKNDTTCEIGLEKGIYFFRFSASSRINLWNNVHIYDSSEYSFKIKFSKNDNVEKELNDSFNTATKIEQYQYNKGSLKDKSDCDFYKFEITEAGNKYIDFTHQIIVESGDYEYFEIRLYDSTGKEIKYISSLGNKEKTKETVYLEKGTYYIRIGGGLSYGGHLASQKYTSSTYTLCIYDYIDITKKITATQTTSTITLKWNAVPGATGYRVYSYNRATGKYTTLSTIQKTSGTVKNLTPGTEYNYLIRPYVKLADGTLVWASYSKDDIFVTGTIPAKATAITATQSTSAIKLTWKEKGGATGYRVYEYNKTTGKYTKLGTVQKLNGTIKNLKAGTTYGYLVRAYTQLSDGTVLWADYSKNDVFYTATKAVAPTLKATAGTKKFTLSWNKVAGATSYEVWYSNSANGTYKKLTTVTGTTYSKSCTTGKTYYFKVRAMTTVNGQSIKGEASTAKGVKIK